MLAGCGNSDDKAGPQVQAGQPYGQQMLPEQQAQQQYPQQSGGQPVIINQQAPAQDSGLSNMLLGGLIGHAIGSSGNSGGTRVIERRYEAPPAAIAPAASSSYQQPVQLPQAAQQAPAPKTYAGWGSSSSKPAAVEKPAAKTYSGWGSSSSSSSSKSAPSRSYSYGKRR
jgi:hypothetical protein